MTFKEHFKKLWDVRKPSKTQTVQLVFTLCMSVVVAVVIASMFHPDTLSTVGAVGAIALNVRAILIRERRNLAQGEDLAEKPPKNPATATQAKVRLPGSWVPRALRCIVSDRTMERELKPALADMQYEYARALSEPKWRRGFILLRGYFALASTLGLGWAVRAAKAIWKGAMP